MRRNAAGRVPFSPHAPTPPPPAQHSSQHSRHGSAADSPLRQSGGTDTPPRRAPPQYLRMVPGEPFVPTYEWQVRMRARTEEVGLGGGIVCPESHPSPAHL